MTALTIELDDKRLETLQKWADDAGLKIEELARDLLEAQAEEAESTGDFTPEQRAAIEAGLKAIEEGRTTPHEQVMAEARRRIGR